jgi:putative ABC transport system ATP-binding protein
MSTTESAPLIRVRDLSKTYSHEAGEVLALRGVSFDIRPGEFVSIMGQSGSGKSTLLHVLGCLHQPTGGQYLLEGVDVGTLDDRELSRVRNERIGFVFQRFNLLAQEDVLENVALPLVYAGVPRPERRRRARAKLELVGLAARLRHHPAELSGGESQRVAVARALVVEPAVLLADEPTGNLDSHTGEELMAVFQELHRQGCTLIQVTHDQDKALYSERILRLRDGQIEREERITPRALVAPAGN